MARAIWKGAINFGMVVIPVKLFVATESKILSFTLLHRKCLTKPKQLRYCSLCNEYFNSEDTVRGYEYAKGHYIVVEESDLEKVPVKTVHAIDVLGFVDAAEIDPIYYRGSFYLEPEELAAKPFFLLRQALIKTRRIALAKVTFHGREHLCCLRPLEDTLVLHTMYYHDEIRSRSELVLPKQEAKIAPEELKMAVTLIEAMAMKFRPEEYRDEYRLALEKLIEAKVQGQEIVAPAAPVSKVTDLMAALKASIESIKKERPGAEEISKAKKRVKRQHEV